MTECPRVLRQCETSIHVPPVPVQKQISSLRAFSRDNKESPDVCGNRRLLKFVVTDINVEINVLQVCGYRVLLPALPVPFQTTRSLAP